MRAGMVLVVTVLAACATRSGAPDAAAGTAATPAPTANAIVWSPERSLTWSDFMGMPKVASDATAMTVYVLSFRNECSGSVFSFDVTSSFLPHLSWVKPSVILDERQSTASLQHERTHFDVSELSARTLRQTLRTLERPCALSTSELNTIVTRVLADDARTQERYDRETVHGSNRRVQAQWDASVRAELARTVAHAGR